jgi:hypothetical protein
MGAWLVGETKSLTSSRLPTNQGGRFGDVVSQSSPLLIKKEVAKLPNQPLQSRDEGDEIGDSGVPIKSPTNRISGRLKIFLRGRLLSSREG